MKKIVALIVALCTCLAMGVLLTACGPDEPHVHAYTETVATADYIKSSATCQSKATYYKSCKCGEAGEETFEAGELGEHDFSDAWVKGNGKHWHTCQTTGCSVVGNEESHSYTNGECACGELEASNEVTKEQWEAAFLLENVTINQYLVMEGQKILMSSCLIDGADVAIVVEGITTPTRGQADMVRMMFDFTGCYNDAEYQEGRYFVEEFDVVGDGSMVYEDAYLTFENGVLQSISVTIKEVVPEYDNEYNVIGTTIETSDVYMEFVDYGTTNVVLEELPISQYEWEAIFSTENLNNVTVDAYTYDVTVDNDIISYDETWYFVNGDAKVTVDGYTDVALYFINSTWYTYKVSENTFVENIVFEEYPNLNILYSIKGLFEVLKDMYFVMEYDSDEDVYLTPYDINYDYYFVVKLENGKVRSMNYSCIVDGQKVNELIVTFYDYGTTSFTVPFDPSQAA